MKNITPRHKRFVEAYCTHFNGAEAAREAGYAESRARRTAYDLLQDEDISQMVEDRLEEMAMSAAEATKRMADIARGDIGQFFEVIEYEKDGETREALAIDKEAVIEEGGGLIKEISFDKNGRPKVKLYDAQKALRDILKAHGAFEHPQDLNVQGLGDFLASAFDDE